MIPGQIILIFGDPVNLKTPLGKAKLIGFIADFDLLEEWSVEYLDLPHHYFPVLIKKEKLYDDATKK